MRRYCIRYATTLSLLAVLLPALLPGSASALEITPFKASYKALRNGQHVANADFSLQQSNAVWIWRMDTRPRGLYSWLTRKQPWRETHMQQNPQGQFISIETEGDYHDRPAKRAVWFDLDNQRAYFADGNQQHAIEFSGTPHNYDSIHLVYLDMKEKGESSRKLLFYRKGGFGEATLTLTSGVMLKHEDGKAYLVDRMQQTFADGKRHMTYDYDPGSPAPLRIERRKGDTIGVLWRQTLR